MGRKAGSCLWFVITKLLSRDRSRDFRFRAIASSIGRLISAIALIMVV